MSALKVIAIPRAKIAGHRRIFPGFFRKSKPGSHNLSPLVPVSLPTINLYRPKALCGSRSGLVPNSAGFGAVRVYRPSAQAAVRGWHLPCDRSSALQRPIAAFWASG
jgi:hypothetical protein